MSMSLFSDLLNLFFPNLCAACRKRLVSGEKYICLNCLNNIPRTKYYKTTNNSLEEFFAGRFPFERIASFAYFVKGGSIQSVIHELKYNNNPEIGLYIGQLCGKEMKYSLFLADIDYLLPVPLHPKREKKRGYNQALKIAEGISSEVNIPISDKNLIRVVNNLSQTQHSKFERWKNTEGIFDIINPALFEDKHVLLIDDIITTGSTLESCAKAILENCQGARISIYSIGAVM